MGGWHLIQDNSENVASWEYCFLRYITLQKNWYLGSTVFQDTSHFGKRKMWHLGSTGSIKEMPPGKEGKINTSQAEPVAANSSPFPVRRFVDEPGTIFQDTSHFGKRGIPRYITLRETWHKPAKLGYNDKTLPLSSGSLGKMQSSDLKS